MRARLSWALPLLLLLGCKPKAPEEPDSDSDSGSGEWKQGNSAYGAEPPLIQPREVCEHLARMVAAEAGVEPQFDPQMMAECESELTIEAGLRGTDNWNAIAACVLKSRTEADIDYCDRTYPIPSGPGPGNPGGGDPGDGSPNPDLAAAEREIAVCEHMVQVIINETAAELGEMPAFTDEDLRQILGECVRTFVEDERPNLAPAEYTQLLECFALAETGAQMQLCE